MKGEGVAMEEVMSVETEIVQEFTGRYLKITAEGKGNDLGEKMLRYNKIEGILGAEVQQIDDMLQYLYAIGDRIPLSDLLKKGLFTADDIRSLMYQIIRLIELAGEYFLDEKDMILLGDCMFWDESEKKLSVVYLDGYQRDVGKGISGILETCMDHMNHKDKELVFLVYGLHRISKDGNFCLNRLIEELGGKSSVKRTRGGVEKNGSRVGNDMGSTEDDMESREAIGRWDEAGRWNDAVGREGIVEKDEVVRWEGIVGKDEGVRWKEGVRRGEAIGQEQALGIKKQEERFSPLGELGKRTAFYGKIIGYVAAGIFVLAAAVCSGVLAGGEGGGLDMRKTVVLAALIFVLEWYVIGKLRGEESQREKSQQGELQCEKKSQRGKEAQCGKQKTGQHIKQNTKQHINRHINRHINQKLSQNWDDQTERLVGCDEDQTVVLDQHHSQMVYLNLIPEDWQREEIKIRKSPFFIGKNGEKADAVICEGDISRLHAKIVVEDDGVFVIDQESTNGTYVNGKRLVPWERRKVLADDKIAFSSVYYRVETGS